MAESSEIKRLVGRLLLGRVPGLELDDVTKQALKEGTLGGVVLFKQNAHDLKQLGVLCRQVIELSYHPPVIAVDQEGGAVQRFDHVLTPLPSPMALAATENLDLVYECASINAKQCKLLGINCLLAPTLDVLSNNLNPVIGTRAFSDSAQAVASFAKVVLKAFSDHGVVAVGKHFPGHGSTLEDSHAHLAVNPNDGETLWLLDLAPFRECFAELPAIMVGHIWVKAIDEQPLPSSLSPRVVTGVLRRYMKYDRLVLTDDMIMRAISEKWGLSEACVLTLEAGADLLLACAEKPSETQDAHRYIIDNVENGRLSIERLKESCARVDKLFATRQKVPDDQDLRDLIENIEQSNKVSLAAQQASIAALFGETISKVKPPHGLKHLSAGTWFVLVPEHPRYPLPIVEVLNDKIILAGQSFAGISLTEIRYPLNPTEDDAKRIVQECAGYNCVLLSFRSLLNTGQAKLGALIADRCQLKINVACDTPFDWLTLNGFNGYLATFDPSNQAMDALASVLLGLTTVQGVPPVQAIFNPTESKQKSD